MSEQNGQEQSNRTNRITLEDVAKALEALGITPAEASAGRIRTHLGRGSLTTIQRHLETLRGEQPSRQAMERRVLEEMKGLVPLLTALGESVVSGQYARLLDQYEEELGNAEATIEGLKAEVEASKTRTRPWRPPWRSRARLSTRPSRRRTRPSRSFGVRWPG